MSIHQVTATSSPNTLPTVGTRGTTGPGTAAKPGSSLEPGWALGHPTLHLGVQGRGRGGRQGKPRCDSHTHGWQNWYRLWGSWHTGSPLYHQAGSPPFLGTAPIPAPHCWWEMSPSRTPVSPQDQPVLRRVGWPQGPAHPSAPPAFPSGRGCEQVELPTAAPSKEASFSTPATAMWVQLSREASVREFPLIRALCNEAFSK